MELKGKTIIITGASDGIGKAAARILKTSGAEVVIIGRSAEKTRKAGEELGVKYYVADFTKLSEVRRLGAELKSAYPHIDYLFNNAGGGYGKREVTADGYEKTFQINHLSHFLLTYLLLDNLLESRAVIVNTSSIGNTMNRLELTDLNLEKRYNCRMAYGNAKLENILFAKEFDRRYGSKGVSMAAFHPGNVATNFGADSPGMMHTIYHTAFGRKLMRLITPEEGAANLVWFTENAPGTVWKSGEYYKDRKVGKAHKLAYDPAVARGLWEESERLAGIRYPL